MPGRGPLYVHVDHDGKPCLVARAAALRLPAAEVRRMRAVFETEDLRRALRLRVGKL